MSISFIPLEGTIRLPEYWSSPDPEHVETNGIYRALDEYPSVRCHNSGGYALLTAMGIPEAEQEPCGTITAERVRACLENFTTAIQRGSNHDYLNCKGNAAGQMLRHCLYHNCGFSWG